MNKNILQLKGSHRGIGIIEMSIIIIIIGIVLIILINGITTTAVVVEEVNNRDKIKEMATAYLNQVYDKASNKLFYDNLTESSFPPIPLTSEFTDAGNYSVAVETTLEDRYSKKVTITYRNPAATSFSDPILVLSTIIEDSRYSY